MHKIIFLIYQYEQDTLYIEGPWESLAVFDGSLDEAIRSVGFITGSASDIVPIYTGNYFSPVNILLIYGWAPFVIMMAANIGLIMSAVELSRMVNLESLKWGATILTVLLTAITVASYMCAPCFTAPLGPVSSCVIDFGMLIVVMLIRLYSLENIFFREKCEISRN